MTRIVIVDEADTPIGLKERDEIQPDDIYRVSAIWITNSKGDILMAQRAFTKKHSPGRWGAAVVGTVDEGEDYLDNAVKEAQEEICLNIDPAVLTKGPHQKICQPYRNFFCQWYFYTTDIPVENLTRKEDEVAEIRWMTRDAVQEMVETEPNVLVESVQTWIRDVL